MISNGGIRIAQNTVLFGTQDIEINLNVDENTRNRELERTFFEDLGRIGKKVVLLIDSFEAAVPELQNWISRKLLRVAGKRNSNLIVIVAGQEVPDFDNISLFDSCQLIELQAIKNHEYWCQFAKDIELSGEEDFIEKLTKSADGDPMLIRKLLDNYKLAKEKGE